MIPVLFENLILLWHLSLTSHLVFFLEFLKSCIINTLLLPMTLTIDYNYHSTAVLLCSFVVQFCSASIHGFQQSCMLQWILELHLVHDALLHSLQLIYKVTLL